MQERETANLIKMVELIDILVHVLSPEGRLLRTAECSSADPSEESEFIVVRARRRGFFRARRGAAGRPAIRRRDGARTGTDPSPAPRARGPKTRASRRA